MPEPVLTQMGRGNPKGVIIDCRHTRYHVVRAAARMTGWVVCDAETEETVPDIFYDIPLTSSADDATAHPPQVIWTDKSVLSSRVASLQCYQRLNHFAAMHVIARKAILFRRLMQLCRFCLKTELTASHGASSSFSSVSPLYRFFVYSIPPSFSSLSDLSRLSAYQHQIDSDADGESTQVFFIIKPNTGCEGRGIRLTTSPLSDLTEAERTDKKRECIIQLYVDRPLLIEGKKFDLRLYVLLVAVTPALQPRQPRRPVRDTAGAAAAATTDPTSAAAKAAPACIEGQTEVPLGVEGVRLYVHREGLVRICAEPYAPPTEANCTDALRHLTNYAVNRKSAHFRPAAAPAKADTLDVEAGEGNKRSLAALAAHIEQLHAPGGWARVRRRIDECITLTILSGAEVLRRELVCAGGVRGDRADGRGCFELLGFDVMLREDSLEPVLIEVNHSPSLFCDTAFDFAVKSAVLRDTFRLIEAHLPPWEAFEGNGATYASYTCPGSSSAARMEQIEAQLLNPTTNEPCGFRRLLPHYDGVGVGDSDGGGGGGNAADGDTCDWQQSERAAQAQMVTMSQQLR
jgi:hypothetical protein